MANPVLNPTLYARVTGIILAATALLGIVMELVNKGSFIDGFLAFDWTHDMLHVALALLAIAAGWVSNGAYARNYARIFGIVYAGLGVAGFFWTGFSATVLHLEMGENLVHLLIGVWGLAAGFLGSSTTETTAARAPRGA